MYTPFAFVDDSSYMSTSDCWPAASGPNVPASDGFLSFSGVKNLLDILREHKNVLLETDRTKRGSVKQAKLFHAIDDISDYFSKLLNAYMFKLGVNSVVRSIQSSVMKKED